MIKYTAVSLMYHYVTSRCIVISETNIYSSQVMLLNMEMF